MKLLKLGIKKISINLVLLMAVLSVVITGCSDSGNKDSTSEQTTKEVSKETTDESVKESAKEKGDSETKVITDSIGREVEIPIKLEKVVTVGPVGVQNCFIFAMDEGDKIANGLPPRFAKGDRWKYHTVFNPKIADNPVVEDAEGVVMIEKLIEVNPDLVFTMDEKTAESIEKAGIKAIVLDWKDPEDVKEVVNLLGEIFNKPERAEEYSKYFDETIKKVYDIVSQIPEDERKTMLNTTLERLSMGHVIADWWIDAAGGISVSKDDRKGESSNYSMEQLFNWNPDVLIVQTDGDLEHAYEDERFKELKAIQNEEVYVTPVMGHVWANRTMEQPLTVLWTAKLLYPEQMKDISMTEELKTFSSKFFGYNLSDEECRDILGEMD